jgi:hypothetical protein
MIKRFVTGVLAAFIAPAIAAPVTAHVPACPSGYPVNGVALTKIPSGWVGEVYERFSLESVTVATEPNHEGEIIPTSGPAPRGGTEVTYDGLDSFALQRWLVCNYGYGGVVRLYQKLPSSVTRCTMKYAPIEGTKSFKLEKYHCE